MHATPSSARIELGMSFFEGGSPPSLATVKYPFRPPASSAEIGETSVGALLWGPDGRVRAAFC
jgi:hypothetical protein